MNSLTVQSGLRGFWLLGSVALMVLFGIILGLLNIPGEMLDERLTVPLFVLLFGLPAYLWGRALADLHGLQPAGRYGWAAGLTFGLTIGAAAVYLNHVERRLQIVIMRSDLEIHQLFMVLFVGVAAGSALVTGLALGAARGAGRLALRLGLEAGLAAGLAFFLAALFMDVALGYQVGAPGAAERATMVTVTVVGMAAAAFSGSAAVGRRLAQVPQKP